MCIITVIGRESQVTDESNGVILQLPDQHLPKDDERINQTPPPSIGKIVVILKNIVIMYRLSKQK